MLVVTRKVGETIMISDQVTLTILSINKSGQDIRIGVKAPKEISIHREEIYLQVVKSHSLED